MKRSLHERYLNDSHFHYLVDVLEGSLKEFKFLDLLDAIEVVSAKVGGVHDAEAHRARHRMLHECFDELLADFLMHTRGNISHTPIRELMAWSALQIKAPNERVDKNNGHEKTTE